MVRGGNGMTSKTTDERVRDARDHVQQAIERSEFVLDLELIKEGLEASESCGATEELRVGDQPWIDGPPKACGDYRLRTKQGGTECVTIRQIRGDHEYMACGTWNPM